MDVTKIKQYPGVIAHKVGNFVDYKNENHKITAVAIAIPSLSDNGVTAYGYLVGISICNPNDEYVEIIGINRAAKMAIKNPKVSIFGTYKGIFAENIIDCVLQNELDFVANNINLYIKGYNEAAKKYKSTLGVSIK